MVFKNKEQVNKKDEELNEVFFFSEPRKYVKLNHIDSYKARERCQADIILLPNLEWD